MFKNNSMGPKSRTICFRWSWSCPPGPKNNANENFSDLWKVKVKSDEAKMEQDDPTELWGLHFN